MNKHGWLIYQKQDAEQNNSFIKWFIDEAEKQNLKLSLILREEMTAGIIDNKRTVLINHKQVSLPDFAIVRTIDQMLSHFLEALEIRVFNRAAISEMCNNKARTHFHLNELSIPMVDTIFLGNEIKRIDPPIPYPVVLKEAAGRGGQQVYMIHNRQEWESRLMTAASGDLVIQSIDSIQLGKDVRVFIVGKEIVGAVLRNSTTDFRSNYKLGGTASWYPLNHTERKMIQSIINHFDFGMVGIDFLLDNDGRLLLNEIEDVVGSRTLSAVSNINILEKYVSHIKSGNPS
ncbi:ATP-grasp domain-containing protein [Virgibacillus siamensis]|uniref:ATP-grasp domain-containing protein n=1 Tax=Virgibacillus siamensis TaxID=480071 RepID=UPI0009842EEE|nr:ATP-grasp domain-containing protein [Virgibacillus siamensis]